MDAMAIFQALRKSFIKVLPEVAEALSSGRPVVALESTIVAHGMPYPQNLDLAKDVSQILREKVSIAVMFHFSEILYVLVKLHHSCIFRVSYQQQSPSKMESLELVSRPTKWRICRGRGKRGGQSSVPHATCRWWPPPDMIAHAY